MSTVNAPTQVSLVDQRRAAYRARLAKKGQSVTRDDKMAKIYEAHAAGKDTVWVSQELYGDDDHASDIAELNERIVFGDDNGADACENFPLIAHPAAAAGARGRKKVAIGNLAAEFLAQQGK